MQRDGTVHEKYNGVTFFRIASFGYQTDVIGFGWTNGTFLELLHDLPKPAVESLEEGSASQPKAN